MPDITTTSLNKPPSITTRESAVLPSTSSRGLSALLRRLDLRQADPANREQRRRQRIIGVIAIMVLSVLSTQVIGESNLSWMSTLLGGTFFIFGLWGPWLSSTESNPERRFRDRNLRALTLATAVLSLSYLLEPIYNGTVSSTLPNLIASAASVILTVVLLNRRHINLANATLFIFPVEYFLYLQLYAGYWNIFLTGVLITLCIIILLISRRWEGILIIGLLFALYVAITLLNPTHLVNPLSPDNYYRNVILNLTTSGIMVAVVTLVTSYVGHELEQRNRSLTELVDTLEARVTARTYELEVAAIERIRLYNDQVAMTEQLRTLDTLKSQFLASMSHELRTPLNAILNFTEFVAIGMLGEVNDGQRDALNKSLDSGRHLLALINDVLDITKIEANMMTLFIEENIRLLPELTAVVSSVQPIIDDKSVQIILDIDADLLPVVGDRRRIRQILLNLLSNAAKFTAHGSITLSARHQGDSLLFAVIDTGPGIAQADQSLIFEPFVQAEVGLRHAGGTGLGLPISKRLAEAHGGRLWIESEPGEGSAFFVLLPIRSEALLRMLKDSQQVPALEKQS